MKWTIQITITRKKQKQNILFIYFQAFTGAFTVSPFTSNENKNSNYTGTDV